MRTLARLTGTLTVLITALALAPGAQSFPGANGDIVYQRYFQGGSEIFALDAGTGRSTHLTSDAIRSGNDIAAGDPAYSPNARRIVFANAVRRRGIPGGRRNNLFVMRADGSHVRRLTRSDSHQGNPAFSPDGSTIVFNQGGDVWAMDANGRNRRNLTAGLPGGGGNPVFSPDGSRIAITSVEGSDADVFLIDPDGSNPVNLTGSGDSGEDDYEPAFSPDGARIAFVSERAGYPGDLYTMAVDGTDVQALTSDPVEDLDPAYSPDGTEIVYTSRRSTRAAIDVFSIPVGGGTGTAVPGIGGAVAQNPDWGVAVP